MPKEITTITGDNSWLTEYTEKDSSLDNLQQHRKLPAIRPVQGTDDIMVKDTVGEGRACMFPGNVYVADKEEDFLFVPLFAYTDYIQWKDRKDTSKPKMVAKTHDPSDLIAVKAGNFKTRKEAYGDPQLGWMYNYTQTFRFAGMIYGSHQLSGEYCTMSFSRGEYRNGEDLIAAIFARKVKVGERPDDDDPEVQIPIMRHIPLYGQIWSFKSKHRKGEGDQNWWGFDWRIPEGRNMVTKEEFARNFAEHTKLKEAFEKGKLSVDDTSEVEVEAETVDVKTSAFGS